MTAAATTTATTQGITNPYGRTKFMMEEVLRDLQLAEPHMGVVLLRYFNPVGAHRSGLIGEDPQGMPNNLMPFVQQVRRARGQRWPRDVGVRWCGDRVVWGCCGAA